MGALEMETLDDEMSTLVEETDGLPSSADMRKRSDTQQSSKKQQQNKQLMGRNMNYTSRNVCMLGMLAVMMGFFLKTANQMMNGGDGEELAHSFHTSSLGGIHNIHQPGGAKAAAAAAATHESFLPVSNVGHAIPSMTTHNTYNLVGHYLHDEHRSPFASHMFDKPKTELDAIQKEYEEKMDKVRKEWGVWKFQDPSPEKKRSAPKFDEVDYRDVKNVDMPNSAWQKDEPYIRAFLTEAKSLVNRVLEGVYAEYGHPTKKADGTLMTDDEKKARHEMFQVQIRESSNAKKGYLPGIAYLTTAGWDGLVTKLLHAMITNDHFYFVLGGHSSAAGHGNNFLQTQSMQFNHLMEPVFDKLGVKLVSRNMAMGGLGTAHFSMGGGGIYGETDFLWWDSQMTEKGAPCDLFNKQAILSGERVPVILTAFPNDLATETNGTGWFGDLMNTWGDRDRIVPTTDNVKQEQTLPWASRGVTCPKAPQLCRVYHSECWYPRSDYTPVTKQQPIMGGRASWHPPDPQHKWLGRVVSLIVLQALEMALEVWDVSLDAATDAPDLLPLSEELWHVGDKYKAMQETLRTNPNNEKSQCATFLKDYPSRICQVSMTGATTWTPRRNDAAASLYELVQSPPNGHTLAPPPDPVYSGIDLAMPSFHIPGDHVDAHAIAIATNDPPPPLDHSYDDDDDTNSTASNSTVTRRWLREQSHKTAQQTWTNSQTTQNKPMDDKTTTITTTTSKRQMMSTSVRELGEDDVVPGLGWMPKYFKNGYCDGSSNSHCGRMPSENCLLYAHNDGRNGLFGDGLSGWIVFTLKDMREGLVTARLEWWAARDLASTKGWTEVNNGISPLTPTNYTQRQLHPFSQPQPSSPFYDHPYDEHTRELKTVIPPYPEDFKMDVAIDGKIVKSFNKAEMMKYAIEITHNIAFWTLYDNEEMAKTSTTGKTVELGLRVTSKSDPRGAVLSISHIYWA